MALTSGGNSWPARMLPACLLWSVLLVSWQDVGVVTAAKLEGIYWNSSNPIFRIDNTDHIIDVNRGNSVFEYDQVNIVCPKHDPNTPEDETEKYIIYNVSKEEYKTCSITDFSKAKIIAQCNKPYQSMCFTITFRSFTPQPGGLEFKAGNDYYFIAAPENLNEGENHCLTKNMRVQFKVCCKKEDERAGTTSTSTTTSTTPNPEENNVIYPFYRPAIVKSTVHPPHRQHNHHGSHEASTVDYWPQYPHVPGQGHKAKEKHHKRPHSRPERPVSDDTAVFRKTPLGNSIDRRQPWERAGKEAFVNGSWQLQSSSSLTLLSSSLILVVIALLR